MEPTLPVAVVRRPSTRRLASLFANVLPLDRRESRHARYIDHIGRYPPYPREDTIHREYLAQVSWRMGKPGGLARRDSSLYAQTAPNPDRFGIMGRSKAALITFQDRYELIPELNV